MKIFRWKGPKHSCFSVIELFPLSETAKHTKDVILLHQCSPSPSPLDVGEEATKWPLPNNCKNREWGLSRSLRKGKKMIHCTVK